MAADFLTINSSAAERLARRSSAAAVQKTTYRVAAIARVIAPGTMKDHIRVISARGYNPVGIVMSDHPATSYVIYGTKAHEIRPRKKGGMLKFEVGGTTVYARVVKHPGTKANNFLMKALLASRSV